MFVILLIPKTRITANTTDTTILFILKKYINLLQLNSKIYHDLVKKNELK